MAEFTRSIVSRLRQIVGDRRHYRRKIVRLPFSLSLVSATKNLNGQQRISSMQGHTLDLSDSGLALIVPKITLSEHHLVGENRGLNVKLELPTGPLQMQVLPVRYESLEEHPTEAGFLIGVRILGMSDADRARYMEYIAKLSE